MAGRIRGVIEIMQTKLVLGSGHWNWGSEWLHIDANPDLNPDLVAVFPPLPDIVKQNKFSTIVASHIIEHVYLDEAKVLLAECYDILEIGGILTLEQPNIEYCMRVALGDTAPPSERDRLQFGLQGVYGLNWTGNRWD